MLRRDDLVYPELSYLVMGCAFDVYNELGFGHHERYYQRAFAVSLLAKSIPYREQVYSPLKFKDKIIGKRFFDFLIDSKIIVELKKDNRFAKQHVDQVKEYLSGSNLKLAILINFTKTKVDYLRVVNLPQDAVSSNS